MKALRREGRVIIIDFRRNPRISSNWVMGHVRSNKTLLSIAHPFSQWKRQQGGHQ